MNSPYRGLFTADEFGVREKHCFRLKIYDRLRASEQAEKRCCSAARHSKALLQQAAWFCCDWIQSQAKILYFYIQNRSEFF